MKTPHAVSFFLFVVLAACGPSFSMAQSAFTGYWLKTEQASPIRLHLSWPQLQAEQRQQAMEGFQLRDVETYLHQGQRMYSAVWEPGGDSTLLIDGLAKANVEARWQQLGQEGYRLIDLEVYQAGQQQQFVGVWRKGTGAFQLGLGLSWKDLYLEWKRLAKQDYRFVDIEPYTEGGEFRFAAVWRAGTYGQYFWGGTDWQGFSKKMDELARSKLNLFELESFYDGEKRSYLGFWNQDSSESYIWNEVDAESFLAKAQQLARNGYQLMDLEQYDGCQAGCDNQIVASEPFRLQLLGHEEDYLWPVVTLEQQAYAYLQAITFSERFLYLPFSKGEEEVSLVQGWVGNAPDSWAFSSVYQHPRGNTFQVRAMADGNVIYAGWEPRWGNTLVISHDYRGRKDAFRTIYTHLRNGGEADCDRSWRLSMKGLSPADARSYQQFLTACGCPEKEANRRPDEGVWGSSKHIIPALRGKQVKAGTFLGWVGATGTQAARSSPGGTPRLEVFVARKDRQTGRWFLIDPYGIYGPVGCYPEQVDGLVQMPCRYAQAWHRNRPQYPPMRGLNMGN